MTYSAMNSNKLALALFNAKLSHFFQSSLSEPIKKKIDNVSLKYGDQAAQQFCLDILSLQSPDFKQKIIDLYWEAIAEARQHNAYSLKKKLVNDCASKNINNSENNNETVMQQVISFFSRIINTPKQNSQTQKSEYSHNKKGGSDQNSLPLYKQTIINQVSEPLINSIVAIRVWSRIRSCLSDAQLETLESESDQDMPPEQVQELIKTINQQTINKQNISLERIIEEELKATLGWFFKIVISSINTTRYCQEQGISGDYHRALEQQDVLRLFTIHESLNSKKQA